MRLVTQARGTRACAPSPRPAARRFASRSQAHPARGEPLDPRDSARKSVALSKTHPRPPPPAFASEEHNVGISA